MIGFVVAAAISAVTRVYVGEIIDMERGYIVFSTGDAVRLAANAPVVDALTGKPLTVPVQPGVYGAAELDASGTAVSVRIADHPFAEGTPIAQLPRSFAVQASPAKANPGLVPPPGLFPTSALAKSELVTITVQVPPQTPPTDEMYISTDTSGWNPQAIPMQRIDGRRFRVSIDVSRGTQFRYLFTRGSWATVESDAAGLRRNPRLIAALGGVALLVDATVRRWIDVP